jgi:hypothetical protein
MLRTTFGSHRNVFTVLEVEELTGKLGHLALTAPWFKYIMTHIYASLAHALNMNHWALMIRSSSSFREGLKRIKQASEDELGQREKSYFQAANAKKVHHSKRIYPFNKMLRKELKLILQAITDPAIPKAIPISHLIERAFLASAFSDSSLLAMGGFCPELKVWWYFEWPESICHRTLKYVKNNQSGLLIDINVLEYAGILVMFLITCYRINQLNLLEEDPHPQVLMRGDNTTSESWSKKASKHSPAGRALGRLQCALMLNNPIALQANHIPTEQNIVADKISRVASETHLAAAIPHIEQEHPELTGCHRFVLSSSLISCLLEIISNAECNNPTELSKLVLTNPGKITTLDGANP